MINFRVQKTFLKLLKLQNVRFISGTRTKITNSYCFMPGDIPLSSLRIGDLLDKSADKSGDKNAVISVHQNISKTYSELRYEAERLASGLISIGLRKGDRIAIYSPNCYEWPLTQFAAAKAGLILVNCAVNHLFKGGHSLHGFLERETEKPIKSEETIQTDRHVWNSVWTEIRECGERKFCAEGSEKGKSQP